MQYQKKRPFLTDYKPRKTHDSLAKKREPQKGTGKVKKLT